VANGANYKWDGTTFQPLSFDKTMTKLSVGFDSALFGIDSNGLIYRYQTANEPAAKEPSLSSEASAHGKRMW
jgi:hypothetical protein